MFVKVKVPQLLIEITEITYRFIFVFLRNGSKNLSSTKFPSRISDSQTMVTFARSINFFPVYDRISESAGINDCDGFKRLCGRDCISKRPLPIFRNQLAHDHWNHCWDCDCLSTIWRKPLMDEILFEIHQLVHRFADGTTGLHNLSLSIHKGKKIALLGNNGAGKSTLFQHLNGILKPTSGTIL